MSPSHWQQIEQVLDEVLERPEEERTAFLNVACAGDENLRGEVAALLAVEQVAPAFLEQDAAAFAAPALGGLLGETDVGSPVEVGQHLGAYRLVRQVGMGGMSVVYLAERADGAFEQQVAVKVLRHPGHHPDLVRRLQAERQILASLDHPHIARVFDGGVTEGGWPYLVMEYVEGVPITEYCAAHDLSIRERQRLFEAVCRAVQHAHQHLVVHRDLKPSNILVTETGWVKLLDFGIAKLLDADDFAMTVALTQDHARPMTPQYAAPEQVRGEAITTATDLYALGVLLYELLTGRRPYQFASHRATEIEQVICEHIPERPSKAVTQAEGTTEVISNHNLERTQRQLTGDLDAITLKALKKEPERRYASAADLLDDLRRHTQGLPVAARDDTARYRAAKFVQRHRTAVALSGLAVLALVIGLVAALWQANVATRERDAKDLEADRANATLSFVLDMFEKVNPSEAEGAPITAQRIVEVGLAEVEGLENQPHTQAQMLAAMGKLSHMLGLHTTADSVWRRSLQLRQQLWGAEHPEVAESLHGLASALQNTAPDSAIGLLRRALAMRKQILGADDARTLETFNTLAFMYYVNGQNDEAMAAYREILGEMTGASWDNRPEKAQSLYGLATVLSVVDRPAEAEPLFRQAFLIQRDVLGAKDPEVGYTLYSLGTALRRQGKLEAARHVYAEVLERHRTVLGEDHDQVANTLFALGRVEEERQEYDEAVRYFQEAFEVYQRSLGPTHGYTAIPLASWGLVLLEQGQYEASEDKLRQAFEIYVEAFGPAYARAVRTKIWLGRCLIAQQRFREAEPMLLEAYNAMRDDARRQEIAADALEQLAALHRAEGDLEQADTFEAERRRLLEAEADPG